jgi:hypothetical protein
VAVAVDARSREFKDAEAEFIRNANCVTITAAGQVSIITASGKNLGYCALLEDRRSLQLSLEKMLKAFASLPLSERKPGAVQVGERGPADPRRAAQSAPAGSLLVRVFNRQLGKDARGELRYTVPEDYVASMRRGAARYREPADDAMWVTHAEWQAMMPANPRKDQRVKVPTSLCERIFRYHLDPAHGMAESLNFTAATAADGQLNLTVESVSADEVQLRLEGSAKLRRDRGNGYQQGGLITYQPRFLGYLAYDPAKKVFTRFDIVALGDTAGQPAGENQTGDRPGSNPLGVAFELVANPGPADSVCPRGARDNANTYLGMKK